MARSRRLVALVVVQAVLLVLVAAFGAWLGRDEFRLLRERPEAPKPAVSGDEAANDGPPQVKLSALAQRNVGLETASPKEGTRAKRGGPIELQVVDVQPLAEARGRLASMTHDLQAARAQSESSAAELRRVQGLYDDDRSASKRALEAARAQAATDAARVRAQQATLDGQRAALRATWGGIVAGWLESPHHPQLDRLLGARAALLRAQVPQGQPLPEGRLRLDGGGDALPVAGTVPGQRFYTVDAASLAAGQRLTARTIDRASSREGAWVPGTAVVWHAGQPWIYLRRDDDDDDRKPAAGSAAASTAAPAAATASTPAAPAPKRDAFQRRALVGAERVDDRWFVPGLDDDDTVVVRGAQVLLSEELKFQIRNENDD